LEEIDELILHIRVVDSPEFKDVMVAFIKD
jgi:hypothetical protein